MIVDAIRETQRDQAEREARGEKINPALWWDQFLSFGMDMLEEQNQPHSPLSPSSIGGLVNDRKCTRQHAYRLLGVQRAAHTPRASTVFRDGVMHEASILADVAALSPWKVHSRQMRLDTGDGEWGWCDALATPPFMDYGVGSEVLIECKSINGRAYNRMLGIKEHGESHDVTLARDAAGRWVHAVEARPIESHVVQVTRLLHGLRKTSPITTAVLIYKNKDTGSLAEFIIEYDPEFHAAIEARLAEIRNAVAEKVLPAREYNLETDWQCSYCSWRGQCWDSLKADRKPEPELPELEGIDADAVRTLVVAKRTKSEAEKIAGAVLKKIKVSLSQNRGINRFRLDGKVYEIGATTIKQHGEE